MAHKRHEWAGRIKRVESEHAAARLAADRLVNDVGRDPGVLGESLKFRDVRHMAERLDETYIIRLFAEFETGLRLFWPTVKRTEPPSRTRDLVDGLAASCQIPHDQRENVHAVREYRNNLVHEREEATNPVPISKARSYLCHFFSYLPPEW